MKFIKTDIKDLFIIEPELKTDERGYFARTFCVQEFAAVGIDFTLVQANRSLTKQRGMIRGMHFQKEPKAEAKVVQCLRGAIYDVAVDLRKASPTYGKWVAVELTEENKRMFHLPKGCAHGFQTLTDNCETQYFMSEMFAPECASGVRWDDPFLSITWPIENPTLTPRDREWPLIQPL